MLILIPQVYGGATRRTSYSTAFAGTENPISESGIWINGGTTGLDWTNIRKTPGLAFGTQTPGGFDDSVACLSGVWGPDQTVQATVHISNVPGSSDQEEVELLLRVNLSAHSYTAYECNFSVKPPADASRYAQIVRIEGALGSFTLLDSRAGPGLNDGDVIKATIVGTTITTYVNGAVVASITDSTYAAGSMGMGFYFNSSTGTNSDYGLTQWSGVSA